MRRWPIDLLRRSRTSCLNSLPNVLSKSPQVTRQLSISAATKPSSTASTAASTSSHSDVDPYKILAPELTRLRETLLRLLGSSHPHLTSIAEYYFLHPSKQLRPLLVLLFARATNGLGADWDEKHWAAEQEGARGRADELDSPLTRPDVLNDWNPNMPDHTHSFNAVFEMQPPPRHGLSPVYTPPAPAASSSTLPPLNTFSPSSFLLPTQVRLAQIVEMIHVASLLHDDVIDQSPLRRGVASAPSAFGNKLSVLAGDFLLGRASAALSRLGSPEVVELIAGVIANLVEGEILQMQRTGVDLGVSFGNADTGEGKGKECESESSTQTHVGSKMWCVYLKKTYLKTASLMAKGARAAVVLGGTREGEIWKEVAYAYGRNLGIAFQVCLFIAAFLHFLVIILFPFLLRILRCTDRHHTLGSLVLQF